MIRNPTETDSESSTCAEGLFRTTAEIVTHHLKTSPTLTATGFVHALLDNLENAISFLHKGLALNRNCGVTSIMLHTCIADLINEDSVIIKLMKFVVKQMYNHYRHEKVS
uniref:Uncharacterized protein n=1 Tax=Glossina pallidipes TaxID=7398 RepID=A0A1B0A5F2_GLOPL